MIAPPDGQAAGQRWCAAGWSAALDGREAGRAAAEQALAGQLPGSASLALVFAADRHDLTDVAAGVRSQVPGGAVLAGCSSLAEINADGSGAPGVAVMLFGGNGFEITSAVATGLSRDPAGAGQRVAAQLYPEGAPTRPDPFEPAGPGEVVLLLATGATAGSFDAHEVVDQQAMVTGVYRITGAAVPLVGGCTGSSGGHVIVSQVAAGQPATAGVVRSDAAERSDDQVHTDAVVAVRLRSPGGIGIGSRHGWQRLGEPLVVTAAEGCLITELDGAPALDVYLELLRAPRGCEQSEFDELAAGHPIGMPGRDEDLLRHVTGACFERRALRLAGPVVVGSSIWLLTTDPHALLTAAADACRQAISGLRGEPARAVLAFDGLGRRGLLGERAGDEVALIREFLAGAATAGFYGDAEIARTRGLNAVQQHSLVVLAVA